MEPPTVRKTFKYQLNPTPEQEWALDTVLLRCRKLYNCALEQRKTWWERGQGKSATSYQQASAGNGVARSEGGLPGIRRGAFPGVLQDVLRRVDKTYQAFFRRVANGDMPGYPRFQGQSR